MSAQHTPGLWNPQPGNRSIERRKNYHAGYSDGFYGYRFGSGDTDPGDDYRQGFDEGRAAISKAEGRS